MLKTGKPQNRRSDHTQIASLSNGMARLTRASPDGKHKHLRNLAGLGMVSPVLS